MQLCNIFNNFSIFSEPGIKRLIKWLMGKAKVFLRVMQAIPFWSVFFSAAPCFKATHYNFAIL